MRPPPRPTTGSRCPPPPTLAGLPLALILACLFVAGVPGCNGAARPPEARPAGARVRGTADAAAAVVRPPDVLPAGVAAAGDAIVLEREGMTFRRISPADYDIDLPGFYLLETEVTNAMYARYLAETGRRKGDRDLARAADERGGVDPEAGRAARDGTGPYHELHNRALLWGDDDRPPPGAEEFPVALVNPDQAAGFCQWLTARYPQLGTFRLPAKREWLAAAYGDGRPYPWGRSFDPDAFKRAYWNQGEESVRIDTEAVRVVDLRESPRHSPEPVTARPRGRTPEGVYGMWGNVGEFVLPQARLRNERVAGLGAQWLGGGFDDDGQPAPRQDYWGYARHPDVRSEAIGFRVLLDLRDTGHRFRHFLPPDAPVGGSVYAGSVE